MMVSRGRAMRGEPVLAKLATAAVLTVAGSILFSVQLLAPSVGSLAGASGTISLDRLAAATHL
jgi:hypothetical protein